MISEGIASIYWFILSCLLPIFGFVVMNKVFPDYSLYYNALVAGMAIYVVINLLIISTSKGFKRHVGFCSSFLGFAFAVGILISVVLPHVWSSLGWYICFVSFFHFSEFLVISVANPSSLSINSFMLNHSYAYGAALLASLIEFITEVYVIPDLKNTRLISAVGCVMCVAGEIIRKIAVLTSGSNFHHIVQTVKRNNHELVTFGIYRFCRHPGYVGWFYWAIGTQLVLVNPVCMLVYLLSSWTFFQHRVIGEEEALINFFGNDYIEYKRRTPSGLPFIHGYNVENSDRNVFIS